VSDTVAIGQDTGSTETTAEQPEQVQIALEPTNESVEYHLRKTDGVVVEVEPLNRSEMRYEYHVFNESSCHEICNESDRSNK